MTDQARGPNVWVPPPLIWVGAWVVAWQLNRALLFEIDHDGAGAIQVAIGLTTLGIGLLLNVWGLGTFFRARTAVIPNRPARLVVRSGPFRFTRNPMYVSITLQYVGLALLLNMAWPLVLLPLVLVVVVTYVIRREEAYMRRAFGAEYEDYCRTVRRWL